MLERHNCVRGWSTFVCVKEHEKIGECESLGTTINGQSNHLKVDESDCINNMQLLWPCSQEYRLSEPMHKLTR